MVLSIFIGLCNHHYYLITYFHYSRKKLHIYKQSLPILPCLQPLKSTNILSVSVDLHILDISYMSYADFSVCFLSLSMMFQGYLCCCIISTSFLFMVKLCSVIWIYILFIHYEYLGCFYFLAVMTNAAMNIMYKFLAGHKFTIPLGM